MDENLTRAAEFHVEALFKDPPAAKEDCPICFTNASTMVMLSFTSTHNYIVCSLYQSKIWALEYKSPLSPMTILSIKINIPHTNQRSCVPMSPWEYIIHVVGRAFVEDVSTH
jgi:hypothetical protein